MKTEFAAIYAKQKWGAGKGSGTGSSPAYCALYLDYLRGLLRTHRRVLDLGCGDWQLYAGFDWAGVQYVGVDVVPAVVQANITAHMASNVRFKQADFSQSVVLRRLVEDHRPDLVLVKDVVQPWSDGEITRWLSTMLTLPFKTLLVTNNWKHFRTPALNGTPRNIVNQYRWAPIDMRQYGFTDVLYYPRGKFKQVARLNSNQADDALSALNERYCI